MPRYLLTPQADSDLEHIFTYSMQMWGASQAEKHLLELDATMQKLADNKLHGKDCSQLIPQGAGLLYYHTQRHYIIYRQHHNDTHIIALYHDRMNLEEHLRRITPNTSQ